MVLVFFVVSILSCTVGSICGIGGGVIIKPVLDATGIMGVSSISFLSGCTVLAMSVVSVYKNLRAGTAKWMCVFLLHWRPEALWAVLLGKVCFRG